MLSSVAERVYWLGRYLERVENTARLVNVYSSMLLDLPRGSHIGWGILIDITGCFEDYELQYETVEEKQVVRFLLADTRNPASVINCAAMMRENARTSREIIPAEAWEQINDLYLALKDSISRSISRRARQQILEEVVSDCLHISGMLEGSMSHNTAYCFIQMGRKLERADMTSRMVDTGSISLLPAFSRTTKQRLFLEPYENIVWMNVLRSLGAYQAYRQQVRNVVSGEEVVRFLLQDEAFPRAIAFCLDALGEYLEKLPHHDDVQIAVDRVRKVISRVDIASLLQSGLLDFIDELQISIADIHDALSETWFRPAELRQVQNQSSR